MLRRTMRGNDRSTEPAGSIGRDGTGAYGGVRKGRAVRSAAALVGAGLLTAIGMAATGGVAAARPARMARPQVASRPATTVPPSQLTAGQGLTAGQSLVENGERLVLQASDGNLVLYRTDTAAPDGAVPVWQAGTSSPGDRLVLQASDGNLVVYAADGRAIWAAGTAGHPGDRLVLQADGNLVVYGAAGAALWQAGTARPHLSPSSALTAGQGLAPGASLHAGDSELVLQASDGNLVIYRSGQPVWSAGTEGHPGDRLVVQASDGNLVIYSASGRALWQAATSGPGDDAVLRADADLVVDSAADRTLWQSAPLPTITVNGFTSTEPSVVYLSGDASNVVTGLRWTGWGTATAVGRGTHDVEGCVPDCAQGTQTPTPTTLTLTDLDANQYLRLTESFPGVSPFAIPLPS